MNNNLSKLISIVKTLRAPNGCDWDREQTHKSLIPYLLEETYEVIEAINENNYESLKEELGDLLLHIIFQAELANEKNKFNIEDSIININKKLVDRHPHVFNDNKDELYTKGNWELTKQKEKKRTSVLEGVPKSLPKLLKARRIQEKAAVVGFDWDDLNQVIAKVEEELIELKEAIKINKGKEEELGDLLFAIVNLSRHLDIDPENSLHKAINKFSIRFNKIEKKLSIKNIKMESLTLEELDKFWNQVKEKE
tara:strand:- start:53 stop:808 length:756 start_codon:yes stop_codon:yes gene_type:complete